MSDKNFYGGSGNHPPGGTPMVKLNGKWYSQVDIDYMKSQSKKKVVNNPVSKRTKPKMEESGMSAEDEQRNRLVLLQNEKARLQKEVSRLDAVINSILKDLGH